MRTFVFDSTMGTALSTAKVGDKVELVIRGVVRLIQDEHIDTTPFGIRYEIAPGIRTFEITVLTVEEQPA